MCNKIIKIILVFLFIFFSINSNGQISLILSDSSNYALDIFCFGKDTVLITCNTKIIKTNNGGITWDTVHYGSGVNSIQRIDFANANYGFGVNNSGCFFRTIDGGNSWNFIDSVSNQIFEDVEAIDSGTAVIATISNILKTNDGGATFDTVAQPQVCGGNTGGYDFSFINKQTGFLGGRCMGTIFTNDSGNTWTTLFWNGSMDFNDISFINDQYGWAIDRSWSPWEHNAFTNDGGFSWSSASSLGFIRFNAIDINNNGVGIVLGSYAFYTIDSGITWLMFSSLPSYFFSKARVADDSTIYVASLNAIFKISNITVGINSIQNVFNNINIYPTLFSDYINIQNKNSAWDYLYVTVYSIDGKNITAKRCYQVNNQIDLSWAAPGNYLFCITTPDGTSKTIKAVKL